MNNNEVLTVNILFMTTDQKVVGSSLTGVTENQAVTALKTVTAFFFDTRIDTLTCFFIQMRPQNPLYSFCQK